HPGLLRQRIQGLGERQGRQVNRVDLRNCLSLTDTRQDDAHSQYTARRPSTALSSPSDLSGNCWLPRFHDDPVEDRTGEIGKPSIREEIFFTLACRRVQTDAPLVDSFDAYVELLLQSVEYRRQITHLEATADGQRLERRIHDLDVDRRVAADFGNDLTQRLSGEHQQPVAPRGLPLQ